MAVILYEGPGFKNLFPLTYLRPAFDLRIGLGTIAENYQRFFPESKIKKLTRCIFGSGEISTIEKSVLFFDGQFLLEERIPFAGPDELFVSHGGIVGMRKTGKAIPTTIEGVVKGVKRIKKIRSVKGKFLSFLWDFVEYNPIAIRRSFVADNNRGLVQKGAIIAGSKKWLRVEKGAIVLNGSSIDTTAGPVFIDKGAQVLPFSIIKGPCYIGKGTVVDGAKIRGGSSFGPGCRLSGEIEATIFQGYGNKHHEGFLGHSFIGEWVNLGAGAVNSDLKNNYQPVKVMLNGKEVNTSQLKVGCFIGDHTKIGIGTLIPTGATVGIFVNFYGGGMMPRATPSFKWGTAEKLVGYRLEEAIDVGKRVMKRRGIPFKKEEENIIRQLYAKINRS